MKVLVQKAFSWKVSWNFRRSDFFKWLFSWGDHEFWGVFWGVGGCPISFPDHYSIQPCTVYMDNLSGRNVSIPIWKYWTFNKYHRVMVILCFASRLCFALLPDCRKQNVDINSYNFYTKFSNVCSLPMLSLELKERITKNFSKRGFNSSSCSTRWMSTNKHDLNSWEKDETNSSKNKICLKKTQNY